MEANSQQKTYMILGELPNTSIQQATSSNKKSNGQCSVVDAEASLEGKKITKSITTPIKKRYWNSWEELRLVELWRRYKDECSQVNKGISTSYRQIVKGMRRYGVEISSQECRRKIIDFIKQYSMERKSCKLDGKPSKWRLYPFVADILEPSPGAAVESMNSLHEVIEELMDEVKVVTNPDNLSCQNDKPHPTDLDSNTHIVNDDNQRKRLCMQTSGEREEEEYKSQFFPLHVLTKENLDEIREENQRLAAERDKALDDFLLDVQCIDKLERFLNDWLQQQEQYARFTSLQKFQNDHLANLASTVENDKLITNVLQLT